MANTYHQIYLQVVFAVKYREAKIDKDWQAQFFAVIGNLINETGCKTVIVNGTEDHVHCFVGLKPTIAVADLMRIVKAKSSKYINDHQLTKKRFEWQEGYGVFSYGQSQIDAVYAYVLNQQEHHKKTTFKDEYLQLLQKFDVEYDEQYVFRDLM